MRIVADDAVGYAAAGYLTIIDGIISPRRFFGPSTTRCKPADTPSRTRCSVHRCRCACRGRPAVLPRGLADPAVIEQPWREFAELVELEGHAVDTDGTRPEEVAGRVAELLDAGTLALWELAGEAGE